MDYFWGKLSSDGGEESACGWLRDKFGLSWQIVPTVLIDMLHNDDREKSGRVMQAMLQMKKIDIKTLKDACERNLVRAQPVTFSRLNTQKSTKPWDKFFFHSRVSCVSWVRSQL